MCTHMYVYIHIYLHPSVCLSIQLFTQVPSVTPVPPSRQLGPIQCGGGMAASAGRRWLHLGEAYFRDSQDAPLDSSFCHAKRGTALLELMELKLEGRCFWDTATGERPFGLWVVGPSAGNCAAKLGATWGPVPQRVWVQCFPPLVHCGFVGLPWCPSRLAPFGVNAMAEITLEMKENTAGLYSHPVSAPLHLLRGFHPLLVLFYYHCFD